MSTRTEVQNDLIDQIPVRESGLVVLAPRVGKSRIIVQVIKRDKYKSILWVTPSRKLAEEDIPKEFITWKAKAYLTKLKTTTWASLHKEQGHYDLIIIDEYQDITEANSITLRNKTLTCNVLLGMTGTEAKHQEKIDLLKALNLKVIVKLSIDEAVDLGLIANYHVNVVDVDLDNSTKNMQGGSKKSGYFQITEAQAYQYQDKITRQAIYSRGTHVAAMIMKRMRMVYNSLSKEEAGKFLIEKLPGRKLVFCGSIDQAERLSPNYYHSKSNDIAIKKFIAEEIDLLTLVNAGGVGWTYNNVVNFIIIQADSDKKGLTTQKIARSLLEQGPDYKASIWVLKLFGTQDDTWVNAFLEGFDKTKITHHRFINLKNQM